MTTPRPSSMSRRPKFWIAMTLTALVASSCGIVAGASGDDGPKETEPAVTATVTTTAKPRPAATVTETSKARPAPTITITITVTKTAQAGSQNDSTASGSDSVYYPNCSAVRAAGAAPIHEGDPGYSLDLDRDGDGTACES